MEQAAAEAWLEQLDTLLGNAARAQRIMTYAEVARALALPPPYTIHQAAELIEALMRRHAAQGRVQLASLVISKARGGLPAPGFFVLLTELGLYDGPPDGPEARACHAAHVAACFAAANAS